MVMFHVIMFCSHNKIMKCVHGYEPSHTFLSLNCHLAISHQPSGSSAPGYTLGSPGISNTPLLEVWPLLGEPFLPWVSTPLLKEWKNSCYVVWKICYVPLPLELQLLLCLMDLQPMKSHMHWLGLPWLDFVVDNLCSSGVVDNNLDAWLGVSKFFYNNLFIEFILCTDIGCPMFHL